jgi:hypothetical protein
MRALKAALSELLPKRKMSALSTPLASPIKRKKATPRVKSKTTL